MLSKTISAMGFSDERTVQLLLATGRYPSPRQLRVDRFASNGVFLCGPFAQINQLAPFTAERSVFIRACPYYRGLAGWTVYLAYVT